MRKILLGCLLFMLFYGKLTGEVPQDDLRCLSYTLRPEFSNNRLVLHVELEFLGNPSGQIRLFLPDEWAGQKELYKSLSDFSSVEESVQIQKTGKPQMRWVIHKPNKKVKIRYSVRPQGEGPLQGRRSQKYWPILDKEYFHFYGMVFFVYPERFRFGVTHFELKWEGFPGDWSIANSFGCQQHQQSFSTSLENVRRSVYVGGDYRIKNILIENCPVFVAFRGGEWFFSDEEFYTFVGTVFREERGFWQDFDFPYFLITLNPFGKGYRNSGGTGLYQSFDVFFHSEASLNLDMKFLFAHELFHTWNSGKLGIRQKPEELIYWFTEGFTDYYARLLLLRAGLISLDEYVSDYNSKLRQYFSSPVLGAPNEKIIEGYWTDEDLGRLPYLRGDVIAHRWNTLINKRTHGSKSLDDLMHALFKGAQQTRQVLSHDLLIEKVKELTGLDIGKDIDEHIHLGKPFEMSGEELGPCFTLTSPHSAETLRGGRGEIIPQYIYNPKRTAEPAFECKEWFKIR